MLYCCAKKAACFTGSWPPSLRRPRCSSAASSRPTTAQPWDWYVWSFAHRVTEWYINAYLITSMLDKKNMKNRLKDGLLALRRHPETTKTVINAAD